MALASPFGVLFNIVFRTSSTDTSSVGVDQDPTPSTASVGQPNEIFYVTQTDGNGCVSLVAQARVNIYDVPTVDIANLKPEICSGEETAINFSSTTAGTTFNFYVKDNPSQVTGVSSGTGEQVNQMLDNPTTASATVIYGVTPIGPAPTNCVGPEEEVVVIVHPKPAQPTATTPIAYCLDDTPSPLSATGTDLLWSPISGGAATTTVVPTPNTNVVGDPAETYFVTQTVNGCTSDPLAIEIIVYDLPVPPQFNDPVYCEDATAVPVRDNLVAGTNLIFYDDASKGGGIGTTDQNPVPNTAIVGNPSERFYVTQTDNNGCESLVDRVDVTVYENPDIAASTTEKEVCSNESFVITFSSSLSNTTFNWVVVSNSGGVAGALAGNGNALNASLVNNTSSTKDVIYRVYATGGAPENCVGDSVELIIHVHPIPAKPIAVDTVTYCKDEVASALSATGDNLLWSAFNGQNPPTSTLAPTPSTANPGNPAEVYFVSQTIDGCTSPVEDIIVRVRDLPAPPALNDANYCLNDTNLLPIRNEVTGTNLIFYDDPQGTAVSADQNPYPVTTAQGEPVTTYYLTQTDINGCESEVDSLDLNVYDRPDVFANQVYMEICSGESTDFKLYSLLEGTTFDYQATFASGGVSGMQGGTGDEINQVLTNQTGASQTVQYTIVAYGPAPSNCPGDTLIVEVLVHEVPDRPILTSQTEYCEEEQLLN